MKTFFPYVMLLTLLFIGTTTFAQSATDVQIASLNTISMKVVAPVVNRPMPAFTTNFRDFADFFHQQMTYPELAQENAIEGTVVLSLWVNASGDIQEVAVAQSAHQLLDAAALKAADELPPLLPAVLNGYPIGKRVLVPLHFYLR